ncbi:hypothetical protein [Halorubrum tebenquichense]|uniref:Uncharacterized protein n=1 Tax=Halorubrum tebenquichense DSM 14210 TaxID=1227485 RepID=M0DWE0_9EURY|nr:hypothetical protein [Halorubrum tebenquichense]ELZ39002.1 hypothetical protein C472_05656 [Halorubrum tebenquichense DSM 14210]
MVEITSPLSTLFIAVFAVSASIVPAFAIMNRFIREEKSSWNINRGIGVMIVAGVLVSGMITVNGIATTSYTLLSLEALLTILFVLILAFIGMVVLGGVLAYPLHWFLRWQEPPDIIDENRP